MNLASSTVKEGHHQTPQALPSPCGRLSECTAGADANTGVTMQLSLGAEALYAAHVYTCIQTRAVLPITDDLHRTTDHWEKKKNPIIVQKIMQPILI